jgi:hypothetical protein
MPKTDIRQFCIPPYAAPAFTGFSIQGQPSIIEVGVPLSGVKTFLWSTSNSSNVQPNTNVIRDVTNNIILASGLPNTGSSIQNIGTIVNTAPMSHSWRGEAVDTQSTLFISSNFTISSIYPYFWGKVSSGGAAPGVNRPVSNQALINSGNKVVASSAGTITINFNTTSDDYFWFAVPASMPIKTNWYVNVINNGSIGGPVSLGGNLFPAPDSVIINSPSALWNNILYNIYVTNYQSAITVPMNLNN